MTASYLHEIELGFPCICWDHHDAAILADRLRRQILAAEMEGR